jgi:hypothetical protein
MKNIELLNYELQEIDDDLIIVIPTHSLISPRFMIKNNNLYIFLFNFTNCYLLKNLPENYIHSIKYQKVFIQEKLNKYPNYKLLITLK